MMNIELACGWAMGYIEGILENSMTYWTFNILSDKIDGSEQDCSIFIAYVPVILQSWTKTSL